MPLLAINTNQPLAADQQAELISKASSLVAGILGKSERYVMVLLRENLPMIFSGNDEPCAYIELKSIGLPTDNTREFSKQLCEFITTTTGITADRIYIEFSGVERHLWGWNSTTFQ